jgi:hypothetical protein
MVARTAFVPGNTNHIALMNQLVGMRNLIINGGFTINQRAYVSGAVLASGGYGHDRWKAGGGGGDYSFTQLPNYTAVTIAANKSLIQVIEDRYVVGGQYLVSWTGTALARYGVNTATPSGSYVSSPIVIAGQNAGTTMSVEFANGASPGTLFLPQLELAVADPTDFEVRHDLIEKFLAWRYCFSLGKTNGMPLVDGGNDSTTAFLGVLQFPVEMRATPTLVTSGTATDYAVREFAAGASVTCSAVPTIGTANNQAAFINGTVAAGLTAGRASALRAATAAGFLRLESEL